MSRIGKQPVPIPDGVTVSVDGGTVSVKGPKGDLTFEPHRNMSVALSDDGKTVEVTRPNDQPQNRALHGLTRSLIDTWSSASRSRSSGSWKSRAWATTPSSPGRRSSCRWASPTRSSCRCPKGLTVAVTDPTHLTVSSPDKQAAGQFAANVRKVRPEPYKGKGIRYAGEQIRRKAGKAFGSGG